MHIKKRLFSGLAVGASLGLTLLPVVSASASGVDGVTLKDSGTCFNFNLPVSPAPGESQSWDIAATFCRPKQWAQGEHQVDVLTHGTTYNSTYWDWPQDPALYSYVDKTLAAGRATLNYDRPGTGNSRNLDGTRPASTDLTIENNAYVLHEIVQDLRHVGFKQINSIGHSMGSGTAMREASTYNDVNRLVLTGYLHGGRNPIVVNAVYQANLDPMFAGQPGIDDGYLTSTPATATTPSGKHVFYSSSADEAVIDYDDAHKDIASSTFFGGYIADRATPAAVNLSQGVKAPVLLIDGEEDAVFCFANGGRDCTNPPSVVAAEAPYYPNAANFTVDMVPNTGHDLALHPSANDSFADINTWLQTH